ncbi:hypothetical protein M409DRAFT_36849 [Zasmidium cellare ATCC 36951]|uniref:Histidine acid phosphatase n=1 Tax=Zasmidium cellare ATCC 36951 TaxID=1080233 RepID=A0A6A6CED4_ZASCE|nr:uncharacterized protein M409DRAFT_36849 [Zasmidium cellare ATCC 36951]KAF2165587.1 hypothetical protein M409DRAFT_36849 [Zasmidium cellare ATCC 36951]
MSFLIALPSLASAVVSSSHVLYRTFYPSSINSTSWYSNISPSTYNDSIYQTNTYTSATNAPYGTYDYCTMPHPRADVYQLPAPVANGSVRAELVYLQYIQRHQRRTSYNSLPGGENQAYDCDNVEAFLYASPNGGLPQPQPMHVFGKTYTDPSNPFAANYVKSTCQLPQLTVGGILDGFQHGKDLWSVYGEKLHFLPSVPNSKTWFRSSESVLTQQSAGGVLRGIWPYHTGPVPLHQQPEAVDTTNESFECDRRTTVLSEIENSTEWQSHLEAAAPLFNSLSWASQNESDFTFSFNSFADNFQARLCNGYNLPCNVKNLSQCATMAQAEEIFRGGDWEWNYWYRTNPQALLYTQTVEGPFIAEIIQRLQAVQNGNSSIIYEHDFLHDNDIGPIAGALGITALRWPGMGSNIAFELWKVRGGSIYARVLYSGQPMVTIYGTLDWILLPELIGILQPYAPKNIVQICNNVTNS